MFFLLCFSFLFFFSYLNRKYRVAKTPPRGPQPCRRACALPASTPSRRQVDPTAPRLAAPLRSASAAHSRTHTLCGATLGRWGVPHRPPLLSALQPAGGMEAGPPQRCQYSEVECPVALVFSFSFFLVPCSLPRGPPFRGNEHCLQHRSAALRGIQAGTTTYLFKARKSKHLVWIKPGARF